MTDNDAGAEFFKRWNRMRGVQCGGMVRHVLGGKLEGTVGNTDPFKVLKSTDLCRYHLERVM